MLKKTIKYTDFDGVEREEDFYFNLNEVELTEWEYSVDGGLSEAIKKITDSKDVSSIIHIFKDLILRSYGEKSADGKRFIKTPELATEFSQTNAYTKLFMELGSDSEKAAAFVKGILPADAQLKLNTKELIEDAKQKAAAFENNQ